MDVKSWSTKRWLVLLLQGVIVLLVLFGKWLGYRINFFFDSVSDSTTLLKVGKSLGKLGEFLSDFQDSGSGGICCSAAQVNAAAASLRFQMGCKKAALLSGQIYRLSV